MNRLASSPSLPEPSSRPLNRTNTVAVNTSWLVLDAAVALVMGVLITIPVNRVIGPERLGYYIYIQFLVGASALATSIGIPNLTRKYMAEYLGLGQRDLARSIYYRTLVLQAWTGGALVLVGELLVFGFSDRSYWASSALLVFTQLPRMMVLIPSLANEAAEKMGANIPATVISQLLQGALVLLSLWTGWDLVGIAAALVVQYCVEFAIKAWMVLKWLDRGPAPPLPIELRGRMVKFWGYGTVLQVLNLAIWDRSDLIFLKMLDPLRSHWTYFSVASGLSDRAVSLLRPLSHATSMTLIAEYGRDRKRVLTMTADSLRYGLLCGAPILAIMSGLGGPLIYLLYGNSYRPAALALGIAAVLAIPKLILMPLHALTQAFEQQKVITRWYLACAAIDVALDLLLIPHFKFLGATAANGLAQSLAVLGTAVWAWRHFSLPLDVRTIARQMALAGVAGLAAWATGHLPLPSALQLILGTGVGVGIYIAGVRHLRLLQPTDRYRLQQLTGKLPGTANRLGARALCWMMRGETQN